jgi:uncharacterized lipoprotein YmbA
MMRILSLTLAVLLAAACASSPPTRFHALATPAPAPGARALDGPAVTVGPVAIPDAVDRPQLVTRRGETEVRIEEFERWAAPLRSELARALAEHLSALRPDARIAVSAAGDAAPRYRVALDVRRFDLSPGTGATLDAVWAVTADGRTLASARTVVAESAGGSGIEALVAAQSRAVERLARDIAAALPPR